MRVQMAKKLKRILYHYIKRFFFLKYTLLTLDTRDNGSLLDSGRLLKTIGINSPEQSLAQAHLIKTIHNLIPVALEWTRQTRSNKVKQIDMHSNFHVLNSNTVLRNNKEALTDSSIL